jgi:hypothetical protein
MDAAAWAAIIIVPITIIGILVPVFLAFGGRQRELRQRLREVLYPIAAAANEYQLGNESLFTERFVVDTRNNLRILSKRDGLKCPNPTIIGQLDDTLSDIPARFNMSQLLPGHGISPHERAQLLENNKNWLNARVLQAGAQAATLIQCLNEIDNYNYRVYRKLRWHGNPDWTSFQMPRLPGRKLSGE